MIYSAATPDELLVMFSIDEGNNTIKFSGDIKVMYKSDEGDDVINLSKGIYQKGFINLAKLGQIRFNKRCL